MRWPRSVYSIRFNRCGDETLHPQIVVTNPYAHTRHDLEHAPWPSLRSSRRAFWPLTLRRTCGLLVTCAVLYPVMSMCVCRGRAFQVLPRVAREPPPRGMGDETQRGGRSRSMEV